MKATFNTDRKHKFSPPHRKEGKCYFESYSALVPGILPGAQAVVELRLYGTGNRWTACIWAYGEKNVWHGSGWAGGYGYHMQSAAAAEAIYNAGIDLNEDISGIGSSAIERAIMAIAKAIGHPEALFFHAHQ